MLPEERRIKSKLDLNRFIDLELKRYNITKLERYFLWLHCREKDILAHHNVLLRKCEYHKNVGNTLLFYFYKILLTRIQRKYGIHIPLNCCDEGLRIMHLGSILMNGNVCIGKNFSIHINTGLVAGGLSSDSPVIGDGVVLSIGAVVLGGVKIANNVAIGANAVVNRDVLEENVAVAGVPAKIISNNGRLVWNKKNNRSV